MAYQSFDGELGDSKSALKLDRISLPDDLSRKSVLDVGCNEGFFCKAALDRGASRVLGVDISESLIAEARRRVPNAEFAALSWWDIPFERFDYILFLSAIHYENEQKRLLDLLSLYLQPDGVLILEAGVVFDWSRKDWLIVNRHDGLVRFPTVALLNDELLRKYSVRTMGGSVQQAGDPQDRHVFHCKLKKPTILCVGGSSGSGKTNFSRLFASRGTRTIHLDVLIGQLVYSPALYGGGIFDYIRIRMHENDVYQLTRSLIADQRMEEFVEVIMKAISKDDDLTIVEGYMFSDEGFRRAFYSAARRQDYRIQYVSLCEQDHR